MQYTSLFSLVAFIILGCYQGCQTRKSLELTRQSIYESHISDSLNRDLTKESINRAQEYSDSSLKISHKSLEISDHSLAAAKKSGEIYESLTKADLRPYIVLEDIIYNELQVGKPFPATIKIINCGKTPAINVKLYNSLTICGSMSEIEREKNWLIEELDSHNRNFSLFRHSYSQNIV